MAGMPQALPGGGYGFLLAWDGVEPRDDPTWDVAGASLKARFRAEAGKVAAAIWDRARVRGLDRHGKPLAALAERTIKYRRSAMGPADPKAPPLTPAHDLSRTRSFLKRQQTEAGIWFWWKRHPRAKGSWGKIVWFHAMGMVKGAPARDVMGFSPPELAAIRARMARWWKSNRPKIVIAQTQLAVVGKAPVVGRAPRVVQTARGRIFEGNGIRFNLDTATMGTGPAGFFERAQGVRSSRGKFRGGGGAAPPPRPRPAPVAPPARPRVRVEPITPQRREQARAAVREIGSPRLIWETVAAGDWEAVLEMFERLGFGTPEDRDQALELLISLGFRRPRR
jgi:hypothetical protein